MEDKSEYTAPLLTFSNTGGSFTLICKDCGFKEGVTSHRGTKVGANTGYQCQKCGKFKTTSHGNKTKKLTNFKVPKYCTCGHDVSHAKFSMSPGMKELYKGYDFPKNPSSTHCVLWDDNGKPYYEKECPECGKIHIETGISGYGPRYYGKPIDYASHIAREQNKDHRLRCECGGVLSREKPLFCPNCKSNNLSYSGQRFSS